MPVVIEQHSCIPEPPPDDTVIWRFMNLSKFLSLLNDQAIFFPQLQTLKARDPCEGTLTSRDKNLEAIKKHSRPEALVKTHEYVVERIFYVSCWHISDFESAGLWSIYASENEGIAVRSTIGDLRSSLMASLPQIHLGCVVYKDFRSEETGLNMFKQVFAKRKSFEFECELRACILHEEGKQHRQKDAFPTAEVDANPPGLRVTCGIGQLIKEVYVAPFSPEWFRSLVYSVIRNYKLDKNVKRSTITDLK